MFQNVRKTYPSHTKAKCTKPGCDAEIRKDRMKEHLKNVHGDTSNKLPGQSNLASFFRNTDQQVSDEPDASQQLKQKRRQSQDQVSEDFNSWLDSETLDKSSSKVEQEQMQSKILKELQTIRGKQTESPSKVEQEQEQEQIQSEQQKQFLKQLQTIRGKQTEILRAESPSKVEQEQQQCESEKKDAMPEYGIPTKSKFDKFFSGHKKVSEPVPSTSTTAENEISLMQTNEDSDVQVANTSSLTTSVTVSTKKSFLSRISKPFKRRKLNSPNTSSTNSSIAVTDKRKLNNILENVLEIKKSVDGIEKQMAKVSLSASEKESDHEHDEDINTKDLSTRSLLIQSSKRLKDILEHGHEIRANRSENVLYCSVCCEYEKAPVGNFNYDFALGEDFSKENMPRQFRNLKTHITKHLEHKTHLKHAKEKEIEEKLQKSLAQRQHSVGMNLGRQAYKILKCGDSHLQYETDVAVLNPFTWNVSNRSIFPVQPQFCPSERVKEQGVDVGTINHSRKFVSELSKSISKELMEQVQKLNNEPLPATGRPSPICVLADKLTPNRRTMQIVGFHSYIGQKFQPLVAGVPALRGEDGEAVTQTLTDGLKSLQIPHDELSSRIVGGAFDGEYFHLSVPRHMMDSMYVPKENRDWYTYQWDPAHILELAEKDAMKEKECQATKDVISTISEVSKSFSYGKSFRELINEGRAEYYANTANVRVPGHFSDTRFATYSSTVIEKWINNYPYYYNILNSKKDDILDKIDNAPFIFSCGGLIDTYSVLGNMSNAFQKPNIPSWEVSSIFETHMNVLNKIDESLDPSNLNVSSISDSKVIPTLGSMVKEISEKHEYQGCPILNKKHTVYSTRSQMLNDDSHCINVEDALQAAGKIVRPLVRNVIDKLTERMNKQQQKNPLLLDTARLFDIKKIVRRDQTEMPLMAIKSLEKYSSLAKKTGNLNANVELDDLIQEYEVFAERVKEIAPQYEHRLKIRKPVYPPKPKVQIEYSDRYDQLDLYRKLLETPELYKDIPNVMHLALTGICRSHCEAVVEGMGSVLGMHNEKRTTLNPETVKRETIIRWQRPHPGKQATRLIENALDYHFKGRENWHFVSTYDKAKSFMTSTVLERTNRTAKNDQKIQHKHNFL